MVIGLLALACVAMAVAQNFVMLVVAIFLLRQAGQGLMTHTAITSQARYYDSARGRAVATAGLGFTIAESFFPLLAVALVAMLDWRQSWLLFAGFILVLLLPYASWLLRGHDQRHERYLEGIGDGAAQPQKQDSEAEGHFHQAVTGQRHHWRRRDVLRDYRFYILLPVVLAPAFIFTGIFFHQIHLAGEKGWPVELWALTYVAFAGTSLIGAISFGIIIDRFGAARVLPGIMPPLGLGCLALGLTDAVWGAWGYMLLGGFTAGMLSTFFGAFWAEVYGTRFLGGIRALTTALMVFSSALSPVLMGLLIDAQVSMNRIALACAIYCLLASLLAWSSARLYLK